MGERSVFVRRRSTANPSSVLIVRAHFESWWPSMAARVLATTTRGFFAGAKFCHKIINKEGEKSVFVA